MSPAIQESCQVLLSVEMCAFWKEGYFSYTYAKYLPVLKFVSGNAHFLEGGYFSYMCAK